MVDGRRVALRAECKSALVVLPPFAFRLGAATHIAAADTAEGGGASPQPPASLISSVNGGEVLTMGDSYTVRWTTLHPDAQGKVVSLWFSRTTADEDEMTVDDSLDLASESIKVSSGIPNVGSYDGRVPQLDFDQPTLWRVQVRASRARTDRVGCHGIRSYSERYGAAVIRELASCAVRAISPLYDPPAAQDTRAAAAAVPPSFTAAARRECCRPAACGASCRRER